jgi:hypothetical protein
MKAILEFNLPDDDQDFTLANNASKYWSSLWELDQHLRGLTKYGELSDDVYKALTETRDKLREIMSDNGVSLDDVK